MQEGNGWSKESNVSTSQPWLILFLDDPNGTRDFVEGCGGVRTVSIGLSRNPAMQIANMRLDR
jgi:hypothetical protein